MDSNNISTPSANEDSMITQLFQQFIDNGGEPKVTEFKKHLNELINSDIKPLCGRAGKAASGNDWRSDLKAKFAGRGAKWVTVALQEINPTITHFESQGMNCDSFKTFIEMKGAAWIRFAGARINNGKPAAAFEVRIDGSTIDHPKHLHMIDLEHLDETIRPLGGTPRSLKLEELPKPPAPAEDEVTTEPTETPVAEETAPEVDETPEVTEPESLEDVFDDFVSEDFDQFDEDIF
jgi:hypothetical protein